MGYESRIYVVNKNMNSIKLPIVIEDVDYGERVWSEVIAMVDVCKYSAISNFMREQPKTDSYIYAEDGNTHIVVDRYDEVMTECSIEELLEVVQKEIDEGVDYRRLMPLYSLLKGFNSAQWPNLRVLHFGY